MTTITPELKLHRCAKMGLQEAFMNNLWGAEGAMIDTPLGRGRIENVRCKFGTDLEVRVDFGGVDVGTNSGMRLFSALELFDMEAGRP